MAVALSHALLLPIAKWLARRFGGVRPEMVLTPGQVEQLRPAVRTAIRRLHRIIIPLGLIAAPTMAAGLVLLRRATEPAPVGAIVDDHTRYLWPVFGVISVLTVLFLSGVLEYLRVRRTFAPDLLLFEHYCATTSGWRPRRKLAAFGLFVVPALAFVGCTGWNTGDVVDANGVAWGFNPFVREREPTSAIRTIELFDGLMAPIGLRMVPNVRVTFADGKVWYSVPDDSGLHLPGIVAEYLSGRSGVPVMRRGVKN